MYEQGAPGCAGRFVKHYGTDRSRYSLLRHQDFAGLPRRHVAPARSREEASVVHAGRRIDLRHLRERRDGLKKSERYCCCERHSGREPSRLSRRDLSTVRALTISRPPSQQRAPQRDPPRDASSAASREGARRYQIRHRRRRHRRRSRRNARAMRLRARRERPRATPASKTPGCEVR